MRRRGDLIAYTDEIVGKGLDDGDGFGSLDRRVVLCHENGLLRLDDRAAARLQRSEQAE